MELLLFLRTFYLRKLNTKRTKQQYIRFNILKLNFNYSHLWISNSSFFNNNLSKRIKRDNSLQ